MENIKSHNLKSYITDLSAGTLNVFADLEFDNPEEMLAKAELTSQIYQLIKKRKLSKSAAAKLLNIDQQKLSALIAGKLLEYLTLQELSNFLNSLGQNKDTLQSHFSTILQT